MAFDFLLKAGSALLHELLLRAWLLIAGWPRLRATYDFPYVRAPPAVPRPVRWWCPPRFMAALGLAL